MSFFADLTPEQQREVLTTGKAQLTIEMSGILLRNGVDPTTFDADTIDSMAWDNAGDEFRLRKVVQGIEIANERLAGLA